MIRSNRSQLRSRLEFLRDLAQTYGDIAQFHTGLRLVTFVNDPDLVRAVLVNQSFSKPRPVKRELGRFMGDGILLLDGDVHLRERRLMQPAFHHKRLEAYSHVMVEHTQRVTETWQHGRTYAIDQEMMKITLGVVARTLFNADVTANADTVWQALSVFQTAILRRLNTAIHLPDWVATPQRRRERQAIEALDRIIYRVIAERQAQQSEGVTDDAGDLLAMLLLATDEDGSKMDVRQVRNEVLSLFVAGHETTANALAWIWYLLIQHESVLVRLRAELDGVLGGRSPSLADVDHLPYTTMVIKEGLRLYPPVWVIPRESLVPVSIGGYDLPAGAVVVTSPYLMHRHPRYFTDPDQFLPERFANDAEKTWMPYTYFPFGGGQHSCIGQRFAMLEATVILAIVAQNWDFRLVPGQAIELAPLVTLRAKGGIHMTVSRRAA
jgi:cytochrome P450